MVLLVMDSAERHGEFIAYLKAESLGLGEADMVGVSRGKT